MGIAYAYECIRTKAFDVKIVTNPSTSITKMSHSTLHTANISYNQRNGGPDTNCVQNGWHFQCTTCVCSDRLYGREKLHAAKEPPAYEQKPPLYWHMTGRKLHFLYFLTQPSLSWKTLSKVKPCGCGKTLPLTELQIKFVVNNFWTRSRSIFVCIYPMTTGNCEKLLITTSP